MLKRYNGGLLMSVLMVQSMAEQERFDNIWIPSWIEVGYELESYTTKNLERYIFHNKIGDYGTLEIVPYSTDHFWPINIRFPYYEFIEIRGKKVFEIEKVAVIKEKRGSIKNLYEMISFIYSYGSNHKYDCAICLLNPDLYNALVWRFNIPVKRLIKIGYEQLPYYPVIFDLAFIKQSAFGLGVKNRQKDRNKWRNHRYDKKTNGGYF